MWLQHLSLKTFRNYKETKIDFNTKLNVFLGRNAQGKTNMLEAIYFLALTRSHRTRTDKNLIHFDEEQLHLSGLVQKKTGSIPLEIELTQKGRVTKVNHLKQARLSDYVGHMNVVLFAPEDLQLIKGAPSVRRKFIDMELGQIKPIYLSDLTNYNHILKQRNTYLKSAQKIDETFLSVLDDQLVDYGCRVMNHRLDFIKKLEAFGHKKHFELSNQIEELSISYQSSVKITDKENLSESFKIALEKSRSRDLFKKNTGIGPHRDDISFYINEISARSFGSQGQQRSVALALKLAESKVMESITGDKPVMFLDDVMSELDENRQDYILNHLRDQQVFITCCDPNTIHQLKQGALFKIHQGELIEQMVLKS